MTPPCGGTGWHATRNMTTARANSFPSPLKSRFCPGTFEYTLNYLIDHELDLSVFDNRYCNDDTGAPAYDPAILLKIILYAYSRGITSSRTIEQCCKENIVFTALSWPIPGPTSPR